MILKETSIKIGDYSYKERRLPGRIMTLLVISAIKSWMTSTITSARFLLFEWLLMHDYISQSCCGILRWFDPCFGYLWQLPHEFRLSFLLLLWKLRRGLFALQFLSSDSLLHGSTYFLDWDKLIHWKLVSSSSAPRSPGYFQLFSAWLILNLLPVFQVWTAHLLLAGSVSDELFIWLIKNCGIAAHRNWWTNPRGE